MFGNLGNLMKQVQQAQKKAAKIQDELAELTLEASAGGLVTCRVNGVKEILDLTIDGAKLGLDPDDAELLQESVLAAVQEALRAADEQAKAAMEEITGGLPIPPGFGI